MSLRNLNFGDDRGWVSVGEDVVCVTCGHVEFEHVSRGGIPGGCIYLEHRDAECCECKRFDDGYRQAPMAGQLELTK